MKTMRTPVIAGLLLAATAALAPAASADARVDNAIKSLATVESDPAKLKTFCAMTKAMANATDEQDEKKAATLETELDSYMKDLGPEFKTAWDAGAEIDPDSADGKIMNAALDKIEGKCEK